MHFVQLLKISHNLAAGKKTNTDINIIWPQSFFKAIAFLVQERED